MTACTLQQPLHGHSQSRVQVGTVGNENVLHHSAHFWERWEQAASCAGGRDKADKVAEASSAPPKAQAEPAPSLAKKGGHRRGNSLSGLLPMLMPKRSPSLPGKLPPDAVAAAAASAQVLFARLSVQ